MTDIRDSLAQVQELKPCPFCGGQPRIGPWKGQDLDAWPYATAIQCSSDLFACPVNPSTTAYTFKEAVADWNRRSPVARQLDASGEALLSRGAVGLSNASGDESPGSSVQAFWNTLGQTGDYDSAIKAAVDASTPHRAALEVVRAHMAGELDDDMILRLSSAIATPRAAEAGDKDGERYRWLREHVTDRFVRNNEHEPCLLLPHNVDYLSPDEIDTAIDSAMQQGGGGGE